MGETGEEAVRGAVAVGAAEAALSCAATVPAEDPATISELAAPADAAIGMFGSTTTPSASPTAKAPARPKSVALHHRGCGLYKFGPR